MHTVLERFFIDHIHEGAPLVVVQVARNIRPVFCGDVGDLLVIQVPTALSVKEFFLELQVLIGAVRAEYWVGDPRSRMIILRYSTVMEPSSTSFLMVS